jgi:hypothetical protein
MAAPVVEGSKPRHLLARILDTPDLPKVVQSLEPRVLHQLVRYCGLEDCGEIIALATTEQLMRVFDDDLWRNEKIGEEDEFDADRFGLWLEVLAEVGVSAAAEKVVQMDFGFVTAAFSRHVLVLDQETLLLGQTAADSGGVGYDPVESARAVLTENALEDSPSHDVGGFRVIAKRGESWDALLSILIYLEDCHPRFFGRLMKRCGHLTTEHIEDNGGLYEVLTADEQVMADIAGDRERRQEEEGYVTPSQATAFLKLSRQRHGGDRDGAPGWDPVTAGYFRDFEQRARASGEGRRGGAHAKPEPHRARGTDRNVTSFLATLREGGVLPRPRPRLLPKGLAAGENSLSRIREQLEYAMEHDAATYSRRTEELAYLANVLIAGCSIASRRFRAAEAADAVLATCNLGLENWPPPAGRANPSLPPAFLLRQDLVAVFRTGWSVLYERVCIDVAERLVQILAEVRSDDDDLQDQLRELRRGLRRQIDAGTPWLERDNLDVIAILDQPSWAVLLGLLAECPVVPKVVEKSGEGRRPLRVVSEYAFISENHQIAWLLDFLESLPRRLLEP